MAQDVAAENVHLQQEGGAEDVNSPLRDILEREDENDRKPENNLANQLLRALGENDAFECWKLLERNHAMVRLEHENFRNDCKEANKKERQREGRFRCGCRDCCTKMFNFCPNKCKPRCCSNSSEESNDEQQSSEPQGSEIESINDETKLNWIKIHSNPLFIGLEWLWRTKSNCKCRFCKEDGKLVGKEKEKKEDVIESSLHDAYLLDEASSLKHYNSRDVYRKSAEAYETFAAGVLKKASQKELYQIMDIEGVGCLLQSNPNQHKNFIQSLSLLKSAVNKRRKKSDEDKEWKFSRAQMWLEYIDKGNAIPVPFNLVYYTSFVLIFIIGNLVCWIATACCGCKCNKKKRQEDRRGTVEMRAMGVETNVEGGDPQAIQINEEQGSEDQVAYQFLTFTSQFKIALRDQ